MYKILIGSPVRQSPSILDCFLDSLSALNKEGFIASYFFVDDNDDERSSRLLTEFLAKTPEAGFVLQARPQEDFVKDQVTHRWTNKLVWRVANHKNSIIRYALDGGYDYLFLVDSDLVLHPNTVLQLINSQKDIISEIFWTKWQPNMPELPQVWACDHYTLYELEPGERVSSPEASRRSQEWLGQLRKPGVYRVGGLGACTLIARCVLERGIDFSPLYNLSFWGEDRHFCIRAVAKGFELFVDTHYPAFHIYRQSDVPQAQKLLAVYSEQLAKKYDNEHFQLVEETQQALISYGTTQCYQHNLKAGLHLFFPKLREQIYQERLKIKNQINQGTLTTHTEVQDLLVQEPVATDKAIVSARVTNYGLIGKSNFSNTFLASVRWEKSQGHWLITGIDFKPVNDASTNHQKMFLPWNGRRAKANGNRITLSMIVRNEANRYLRLVLEQARCIIDDAVIIDDGSTDATPDLVKEILKDVPLTLLRNERSDFEMNESKLRQALWKETVQKDPDWILCLDADEIFEDKAVSQIRHMINQPDFDYYSFRLFDLWDEHHYREDSLWSAHFRYHVLLIRYQPNFDYQWNQNPLHCGRFPANVTMLPGIQSPLRVKHLGWMNPQDRLNKYLRYKKLDPEGRWRIKEQYESILDQFPRLIPWKD